MDVIFEVDETTPDFTQEESLKISEENFYIELAKGLHEETKRPMSGILNHCTITEASDKVKADFGTLMEGAFEQVDHLDAAIEVANGRTVERTPVAKIVADESGAFTGTQAQIDALRNKAKDMGIKNWHNMRIDNLNKKIAEVEGE